MNKTTRSARGSLPWVYFCDICVKPIEGTRYSCSECLRYDVCPSCNEKQSHQHLLYKEDLHAQEIVDLLAACPSSGQAIQLSFQLYAHRLAFGYRDPTYAPTPSTPTPSSEQPFMDPTLPPLPPYRWITFEETGKRVHNIGNGLRQLISPRSFVGLCSHVQLPWYLADYACQIHSMIGPALNPTCSVEDIVHVVNSTQMKLVFASSDTLDRLASAAPSCPSLQFLILLSDSTTPEELKFPSIASSRTTLRRLVNAKPAPSAGWVSKCISYLPYFGKSFSSGNSSSTESQALLTEEEVQEWKGVVSRDARPAVLCLSDLEYLGRFVAEPDVCITKPEELESLIYTSGSTGTPKGAMFSGSSWKVQLCPLRASSTIEKCLSWTVSDRINDFRHLYYGSAVGIYNGDISRIFEDLQCVRPHQLNATPALWNKIYAEFKAEFEEELRKSAAIANDNSRRTDTSSPTASSSVPSKQATGYVHSRRSEDPSVEEIRKRVLKSFANVLGGRVERIVTGGAPTSPEVIAFLWECFQCRVAESYGTTEAGGILTAGQFVKGLEWKLIPWETYTPDDKPNARGELCVKRANVMMSGYFGEESLTSEALDSDGFYHTGDIVELNHFKDGVTIVDRKKNIFKLAQGEFVAPAKIEKLLLDYCPFVKQVFVYGDTLKSSLVAIIVPHTDLLVAHLKRHFLHLSIPSDLRLLCNLPQSKEFLLSECARIGHQYRLRSFEIPANICLSPLEFSVENGLMTPSEKASRHALAKHFRAEIEDMYCLLDSMRADTKKMASKFLLAHFNIQTDSSPALHANLPSSSIIGTEVSPLASTEGEERTVQSPFFQVGGDSLSAIKLRNLLKKNFSVSVPVQLLLEPNLNIDQVAEMVCAATAGLGSSHIVEMPSTSTNKYQEIVESGRCPSSWHPASNNALESGDSNETHGVFLTGATGFLGTALLCELIRSTSDTIYCLVRDKPTPSTVASAQDFLASRLRKSGLLDDLLLKSMEIWFPQRVRLVKGALETPKFGQSEDDWIRLCKSVSVIYHCAAHVNSTLPYGRLAPANVNGTRSCIEMCTIGASKLLVHVSTTSVLNLLQTSMIPTTNDPSTHQMGLEIPLPPIETVPASAFSSCGGYSASKFVAEHLVWDAISKGFSCIVLRSGFIGSSSTSGFANLNDFDNRLLTGIIQLKCAPYGNLTKLITTPVDFICEMMLEATKQRQETSGKCFHLENNQSMMTLELLVDSLIEKGFTIECRPYTDWQFVLKEKAMEDNPLYPMIESYFSSSSFPARVPRISTENFEGFLRSHMGEERMPETGKQFVSQWIDWLLACGHLPTPVRENECK